MEAGSNEVPEPVVGHPMGARKMALIHEFGASKIAPWIEAEDDQGHFSPAGAFIFGVEEPEIGREMCAVVVG